MFRTLTLAMILGLGSATLTALPLAAQDGPLRIEITDGVVEPMAIAIADFHGDSEAAAQIRRVVASDLTGTGLFREIPSEAMIAQPDSFSAAVAYEDWRAVNAQALVTAEVTRAGDDISVKFRLFDVFAGQPLGDGMQFDARAGDWRRAAHKIADQIYSRLTGEQPISTAALLSCRKPAPRMCASSGSG